MNLRGVQKSLIKKLTVLIIFHFNFFKLNYLQKLHKRFSAKHYTLVKASKQYNKLLVSKQNKTNYH